MSLLTVAKEVAKRVSLDAPSFLIGNTDREWCEIVTLTEAVADEMARRVDWGQLTRTATITGTGTPATGQLPSDFHRVVRGIGVTAPGVVRPLSRPEWQALTMQAGTPRYFLLEDNYISFFPFLPVGAQATVHYQSRDWCSAGTSHWVSDNDTCLIDERVLELGTIARWRRMKGLEHATFSEEYEAALAAHAGFNDRRPL